MIDASMFIFGEEPAKKPEPIKSMPRAFEQSGKPLGAPTVTTNAKIDLSAIQNMFLSAHSKGLKTPKYRANGLVLSMAPMTGKNPGAIYVKTEDAPVYLGKVLGATFYPTRECTDEHKQALNAIAANPLEAAVKYGRLTGNCACCGRPLTDKHSVAAGIGPICQSKWSLLRRSQQTIKYI